MARETLRPIWVGPILMNREEIDRIAALERWLKEAVERINKGLPVTPAQSVLPPKPATIVTMESLRRARALSDKARQPGTIGQGRSTTPEGTLPAWDCCSG